MNSDPPDEWMELKRQIKALAPDASVKDLMGALSLRGWDASEPGGSFCVYSWSLAKGHSLHALFAVGDGPIVNRFGAAAISRDRIILWSVNPDDTNCHQHDLQRAASEYVWANESSTEE